MDKEIQEQPTDLHRYVWKEMNNLQAGQMLDPDAENENVGSDDWHYEADKRSGIWGFVNADNGNVIRTTDGKLSDRLWDGYLQIMRLDDADVPVAPDHTIRQQLVVAEIVAAWAKQYAGGCWGNTSAAFVNGRSDYWTMPLHLIEALMGESVSSIINGRDS